MAPPFETVWWLGYARTLAISSLRLDGAVGKVLVKARLIPAVVIGDPKQVHMIAHAKVKTDTIGATILAKLGSSETQIGIG